MLDKVADAGDEIAEEKYNRMGKKLQNPPVPWRSHGGIVEACGDKI